MKRLFFIFTIAIISVVTLKAQDTLMPFTLDSDPFLADTVKYPNLYDNGIGLSYSTMSGYGLTFLRRFLDDYSFMFIGFITYEEYTRWKDLSKTTIESDDKNINYDFGIEFQRDIIKSNRTKIYSMIGASYTTETKKNQYSYMSDFNDIDKKIFSIGLGFGLQWYMAKNFAGYFHFGYKFQNSEAIQDSSLSVERKTTLGIGFGVLWLY